MARCDPVFGHDQRIRLRRHGLQRFGCRKRGGDTGFAVGGGLHPGISTEAAKPVEATSAASAPVSFVRTEPGY